MKVTLSTTWNLGFTFSYKDPRARLFGPFGKKMITETVHIPVELFLTASMHGLPPQGQILKFPLYPTPNHCNSPADTYEFLVTGVDTHLHSASLEKLSNQTSSPLKESECVFAHTVQVKPFANTANIIYNALQLDHKATLTFLADRDHRLGIFDSTVESLFKTRISFSKFALPFRSWIHTYRPAVRSAFETLENWRKIVLSETF